MESDSSNLRGVGSAITITAKIVRFDSHLIKDLISRKHGSKDERGEQHEPQQNSAKAATRSKRGSRTRPASDEIAEGNGQPCASPIIHGIRSKEASPLSRLHDTFEENPECCQHYDSSSKPTMSVEACPPDNRSGLSLGRSLKNTKNSSLETIEIAKTPSERCSITTADLGSRRLLCFPRPSSRPKTLRIANIRLKKFIRPKSKAYSNADPVPEDSRSTVGTLQKLDLTVSKRHLPRKASESSMEGIVNKEITSSHEAVLNKGSNTSIVDLNQAEASRGLERCHQTILSESWDEIFKSMDGSGADAGVDDSDDGIDHNGPQSVLTGIDTRDPGQTRAVHSPSERKAPESRSISVKTPPLPGPRTSSITALADERNIPRSFQFVVAELPGQPEHTHRRVPRPVKHEGWPAKPDMSFLRAGRSPTPRVRESRFSEEFSKSRPAPGAAPSSIVLDTIGAEISSNRPLSPSVLTKLTPPSSVNCTLPQPVAAPTHPPIGPLPELPENSGIADAASRVLSHPTFSTRISGPNVPSKSLQRRNPSGNPASSILTLPAINAPKVRRPKHTSLTAQILHKSTSLASTQSAPAGRRSNTTRPRQKPIVLTSNNANITDFNQYKLGNSQDLQSLIASETSQEKDMAAARPPKLAHDVLLSRSEHIRSLKLRDLATEKATRTRSQQRGSDLDDTIVVEKPSFSADDQTKSVIGEPAHLLLDADGPSNTSKNTEIGDPGPASHHGVFTRRSSYSSHCGSSYRASQRTIRPAMSPSQIMVLAETDPDSQMFRASTPTGSLGGNESQKARSVATVKERKLRKYASRSKSGSRSELQPAAVSRGKLRIKPHAENTVAHSGQSTHSSGDDGERRRRITAYHHNNHMVAQVKEDSDIESTPSNRALSALANIEERKYSEEQLLLTRLKHESSELKLALRLLSRGLEKLTTFVGGDEEPDRSQGHGLAQAKMKPASGMSKQLERSLSSDTWERFGPVSSGLMDDHDPGKEEGSDQDACVRRVKSIKTNDARPLSLIGRCGNIRHGVAEGAAGALPVDDEMIWTQVDRLNRPPKVSEGPLS